MEDSEEPVQAPLNTLKPIRESLQIEGRLFYSEGNQSWNGIRLKKEILREFPQLKDKTGNFKYVMIVPSSYDDMKKRIKEVEKNGEGMPILLFLCKE